MFLLNEGNLLVALRGQAFSSSVCALLSVVQRESHMVNTSCWLTDQNWGASWGWFSGFFCLSCVRGPVLLVFFFFFFFFGIKFLNTGAKNFSFRRVGNTWWKENRILPNPKNILNKAPIRCPRILLKPKVPGLKLSKEVFLWGGSQWVQIPCCVWGCNYLFFLNKERYCTSNEETTS